MKIKLKAISLFLALNMMAAICPNIAFATETDVAAETDVAYAAETDVAVGEAKIFPDTTNHWAEKSIARWGKYGVINGDTGGKFRPYDDLTRGEMATVVTKLLGLTVKAENTYIDLKVDAWYSENMLKCIAAGIMECEGNMAMPDAGISRQEAMFMLARALGIEPAEKADLAMFSDGATVANWAAGYVTAMAKNNIIIGIGNDIVAPMVNIKRSSALVILDKAVSDYINMAGIYDKLIGTGIVLVTAPDVTLKGNKIAGNLLVSEGVGDGNFTLNGINIAGKTTIRGGGLNSFMVNGGSRLGDVTIARTDGAVRIVTGDGSTIETTYINDGKDTVIMEGFFGNVNVAGEVPVIFKGATAKTVTATGKNADITVGKSSKIETVATRGENSKIKVDGTVNTVAATEKAVGVKVTISKGGTTANVTTAAPNSNITVAGTVTNISATKEATGVNMNVLEVGNVKKVATAAPNSTIFNYGKMGIITISKNATTSKIVVGEKAIMEKIVNEEKENLTVTTAGKAENKPDEIVVPTPIEPENPEPEIPPTEPEKPAPEEDNGPTYSTVTFVANGTTIGTAPSSQSVIFGGKAEAPGEIGKGGNTFHGWFKTADFGGTAWDFTADTVTANTTLYAKWVKYAQADIDAIIIDGVGNVNTVINANNSGYAELSALPGSAVDVAIKKVGIKVSKAFTDIITTLFNTLKLHEAHIDTLKMGSADPIAVTNSISEDDIENIVNNSGLKAANGANITGKHKIGILIGQNAMATIKDVNGAEYSYILNFKVYVDQAIVDRIVSGAIADINDKLVLSEQDSTQYAQLTELTNGNTTVNITNGNVEVTKAFTDIFQSLAESLSTKTHYITSVTVGTEIITLSEGVPDGAIAEIIKTCSLTGANGDITGSDNISALNNQHLDTIITDKNGATYTYTFTFVDTTTP